MSMIFRVLMILVCAYAGWETANFQLQQLPEFEQLTRSSSGVCTENLNTGVVVMKSAQDGA